jgi:DnaJ-class molecular chaperone
VLDRPRGIPPRFEEIEMSDQTKDCEECFGTGNEARMRAPQPGRKILFHPCPKCGGVGRVPVEPSET